ncbi:MULTISPECIES: RNA polymerase sigma factor [unclassified Legionella]|uniref:RNA polymerase sigma factor n=1 Tax=unclassified Legionella TaxID=2622702 RepID=UPI0010543080|nr:MULTISPECIES: sigma-70 family RNA polymerase sigma factor [unclassified Legionella]MDI9819455.1 sigma-70 family RNA polymerase sigma factor [Legionella sp. PL877]
MHGMELAEQQLIDLALEGNSRAFNQLIVRYRQKILSQIYTQVSDHFLAHDLAQEVLIKVFRYLRYFKQQSSFPTWLYKITQNTIKNHFRTRKKESRDSDCLAAKINSEYNSPEAYLIEFQLSQQIDEIFTNMSHELQRCFQLYVVKGLSYKAIAKQLHCPLGTVRSRIHRIRSLIKENMKP